MEDPDRALKVGSTEIWLPDKLGVFYASPSMILHYIVSRGYLPPDEFIRVINAFELNTTYDAQSEYERLAAQVMDR